MQQQLQEQYPQYPDQARPMAMAYDSGVKVNASEKQGVAVQPVVMQSSSEPKFVWHCSEYDF
ncbi:MAG: hypothetical protein V7745_05890 [Pseudomonadales bacterium]